MHFLDIKVIYTMECIIIIDLLNLLEQCVIVVIKRKENEPMCDDEDKTGVAMRAFPF